MKWKLISLAVVLSLIIASVVIGVVVGGKKGPVPQGECTSVPSGEGWVDLLDEAHAGNWKNITDDSEIFEIKDSVLHVFGRKHLKLKYVGYAAEEFTDIDLHIEYKVAPGANSGVFLKTKPGNHQRGFEVQVLDDFGLPPDCHTSGAIYDVVTPMFNMSRPTGEWNSYDISVKGREVSVRLNGWLVIQTDFSKMTTPLGKFKDAYAQMDLSGVLAVQDHGGEVWYRNIRVRKQAEAAQS